MAATDSGAGYSALVLGGGGVAGIAWMTGLLAGLADAGQDVTGADVLIGTSAGSNVAAQVGSGLPLDDLFARQADPARQASELPAESANPARRNGLAGHAPIIVVSYSVFYRITHHDRCNLR